MPNPTVPANVTALPSAKHHVEPSTGTGCLSDKRILALADELQRDPSVMAAVSYDALLQRVREVTIGTITGESLELIAEMLHSRQMARHYRAAAAAKVEGRAHG
ncbi:Asp/Glu/hydantoin racemase [Ancylobacter sp. 3268]|uniref:hypothetical protein n=1 Tax=Ancylobacter sp. 3268 TaxID=2817752 RepID=UPI002858D284|nr:hypothetical protein [Ancylobacter sp. 3268]MDR6954910.1 Asp/Glu/hydantoin racemase [Ancylobacter sp. 3268]